MTSVLVEMSRHRLSHHVRRCEQITATDILWLEEEGQCEEILSAIKDSRIEEGKTLLQDSSTFQLLHDNKNLQDEKGSFKLKRTFGRKVRRFFSNLFTRTAEKGVDKKKNKSQKQEPCQFILSTGPLDNNESQRAQDTSVNISELQVQDLLLDGSHEASIDELRRNETVSLKEHNTDETETDQMLVNNAPLDPAVHLQEETHQENGIFLGHSSLVFVNNVVDSEVHVNSTADLFDLSGTIRRRPKIFNDSIICSLVLAEKSLPLDNMDDHSPREYVMINPEEEVKEAIVTFSPSFLTFKEKLAVFGISSSSLLFKSNDKDDLESKIEEDIRQEEVRIQLDERPIDFKYSFQHFEGISKTKEDEKKLNFPSKHKVHHQSIMIGSSDEPPITTDGSRTPETSGTIDGRSINFSHSREYFESKISKK